MSYGSGRRGAGRCRPASQRSEAIPNHYPPPPNHSLGASQTWNTPLASRAEVDEDGDDMIKEQPLSTAALLEQAESLRREQQAEQSEETLSLVIFHLGKERYGLPTEAVRAVVRTGDITPLPRTPAHLLGLTNLRGEILSVLDIKPLLGIPPGGRPAYLVVCNVEEHALALASDSCPELAWPPAESLERAVTRAAGAHYVTGQITDAAGLIFLLDLKPVFEV